MIAEATGLVSGFAIETACVYWVHFSERNRAFPTALCSMLIGGAQVLGIGESIRDPLAAAFFVVGYGSGTFYAVRAKAARAAAAKAIEERGV